VIGATVGIAAMVGREGDADDLLKQSDLALYRAKAESRGTFSFFEHGMDSRLRDRRELETDLRLAIQKGQFELHYQPILNLASQAISAFEALVRWRHPTRGLLQPAEFIGTAEETGLIIPIGEWVLRQACRDAAGWPADVRVAVNLSPAQFKRGDLVAVATSALGAAGIRPDRLELEITESVLLNDESWVRTMLERLRELGVRVAMDDFGTGYSSLSYLRSFPFSKIKIDRSFVSDLTLKADCLAIVQATIQLSDKLGMSTTAEGVETLDQMGVLHAEGCTEIQGFHISRPVPVAETRDLLMRYGGTGSPAIAGEAA
jgi:predicted signal transduction protein with EAL and GGDEF domain